MRAARDGLCGSYGTWTDLAYAAEARIPVASAEIPADLHETLRVLAANYLAHRFDLLGSGWVSPVYGYQAAGFLGRHYPPQGPLAPDKSGAGLERVVNRANLDRARAIWQLIAQPDYEPIDWQCDFRSGYRWSATMHSYGLPIPLDTGADVKVPWELGRLQHLPQLALCAILADAGTAGFAPATRYVMEVGDQLADFIAANPPRYGVNWMCPMDVAIRAANIALTLALLAGGGFDVLPPLRNLIVTSLADHAAHVANHLEYSEIGRSNHYLANISGLAWAGWALQGAQADQWLAFAIAELLNEAQTQFLPDGGNYEGSTSYHRLSAEMVVFSLALLLSMSEQRLAQVEWSQAPRKPWRAAFPALPFKRRPGVSGVTAIVPESVVRRLRLAAELAASAQGADDTIVQIGDTDSGRFFKLHPVALQSGHPNFVENDLDSSGLVQSTAALFGERAGYDRMEAILVSKLICSPLSDVTEPAPTADFGDIAALIGRWQSAPEASRRVRHFPFGAPMAPSGWSRAAFPDFGLYVLRHVDGPLLTFRCFRRPPSSAPRGHMHDDNLAIEFRFGATECRDPGSFVYTPSVAERNWYRSAAAHDAPRIAGEPLARIGSEIFHVSFSAFAECLAWRPNGVAGEISSSKGRILRILELTEAELIVRDCVDSPAILAPVTTPPAVSFGYGRL